MCVGEVQLEVEREGRSGTGRRRQRVGEVQVERVCVGEVQVEVEM